jgi:hypothetical protein
LQLRLVWRPCAEMRIHERRNFQECSGVTPSSQRRLNMSFGKGALLWLIGIPLPIILLLAFFWH